MLNLRPEAEIYALARVPVLNGTSLREDALARTRALLPGIRARAGLSIEQRRAPVETIDDLKQTGLLRLMQPKRFGGQEGGWDVFCEIVQELATACGSQAWVYRVLGDHAQVIGLFPLEAQFDVWGKDPHALASSSFMPVGRAQPVAGGYLLSGRFAFSSGIDHAQWVICGGKIAYPSAQAGRDDAAYFLVPRADVTLIDDWFVTGLEGSGSKSFAIDNVFVPEHRVIGWTAAAEGRAPGSSLSDGAVYRLPRGGYTTSAFSALLVGMGKSMLDGWLRLAGTKRVEGLPMSESEIAQLTAATAYSEIAAAETCYLELIRRAMQLIERGEALPAEMTFEARSTMAFTCQLVVAAANRIHGNLGSSAVYKGNLMERQHRNIMAGVQHMAVSWPRYGRDLGRHLFATAASQMQERSPGVS